MVDLGANLYNALPQTLVRGARYPASNYSLTQPDDSNAGGNSLRSVAQQVRPDTPVGDFSPPARNEQGFGSLAPALSSIRPEPAGIPGLGETASWEKLLEEQQRISEARRQALRQAEELQKAREQAARDLQESSQLAQNASDNVLFSPDPEAAPEAAQAPAPTSAPDEEPVTGNANASQAPEQIALRAQQSLNAQRTIGAGENNDAPELAQSGEIQDLALPGQGQRIDDPFKAPDEQSASLPADRQAPQSNPQNRPENDAQQRVQQLFSSSDNSRQGSNVSYFA